MDLKKLEFREYKYISLKEITTKYYVVESTELIKFSLDELKSILSLLFSIKFHLSNDNELNKNMFLFITKESNNLINTTRDFGRQLIENFDDLKVKRLESLSEEKYNLTNIFRNNALIDFTESTLLDYMTFRSFEYGDFFMNRFSKEIINNVNLNTYVDRIYLKLKNQNYPLRDIGKKVYKSNPILTTQDELLLSFLLEKNLLKTNISPIQYGLVAYIAKKNIFNIVVKIKIYRQTIDEILKMRWNLNKGMGGPRRG